MYTGGYLIVILASLTYLWIKRKFNYWKNRGFLQANASFPLGTFEGCGSIRTSFEAMDIQYKKFKGKAPAVGIYSIISPSILPLDPELLKTIMVRDFSSFHDRGLYYNKKDDPISANLLSLNGKEWRDRRAKLTPIFTSGKMKMMFEIVNEISEEFAETIDRNLKISNILEMSSWSQRFTADTIGNIAFGLECSCLENENSDFLKNGHLTIKMSPFKYFLFFFTLQYPDLSRKLGIIYNEESAGFFLNTFVTTLEYREKNKINRNDFVSHLLSLKYVYTTEQLAAEAFVIFAAGYETSSSLITFTLYELALNQDIQNRLRKEITAEIEENDGKLTYDMLFGFKYLDMVINEALRMYPPIPENVRKCTKEIKIPGTELVIPKGTTIQLCFYSFHHDPEYFPDPETFDPERFNDGNIENIKPFTFLPFGEGPRNCIGMRFGKMQSKIGIVKLIQKFKFTPCQKTTIPMFYDPKNLFPAPKEGMWLKVERI